MEQQHISRLIPNYFLHPTAQTSRSTSGSDNQRLLEGERIDAKEHGPIRAE